MKVFVMGAGAMGNGIAQVAAEVSFEVVMMDVSEDFLRKGMSAIGGSLDRKVKKGTIRAEDKKSILERIKSTTQIADAADSDIVVEAVPEELKLKQSIFKELDQICRQDAILASNTSSLPSSAIAVATSPQRRPQAQEHVADRAFTQEFREGVPVPGRRRAFCAERLEVRAPMLQALRIEAHVGDGGDLLAPELGGGDCVLVKASRGMHLEDVVEALTDES